MEGGKPAYRGKDKGVSQVLWGALGSYKEKYKKVPERRETWVELAQKVSEVEQTQVEWFRFGLPVSWHHSVLVGRNTVTVSS